MADTEFLAGLLSSGATGYARSAADRLLERHSDIAQRFGPTAFRSWTRHVSQRSNELAAAVLVEEPAIFASDVGWSAASFAAREVPLDDLRASLECLHEVLVDELPELVREIPGAYFEAALAGLAEQQQVEEPGLGDDTPENRVALGFLEAALAGYRRRAIDRVLKAADNGEGIPAVYAALQIAQSHVGELWLAGRLSVAQEHFVTATAAAAMTLLAHRTGSPPGEDRTIVVSPAPGNAHELGAKALAHWLEMSGWNAIYIGSQLPARDIAISLDLFQPELLALSIAISTQLEATIDTIRAAREARRDVKILVGGRLLELTPTLWRKMGADGSAPGLGEAVAECERVLGS